MKKFLYVLICSFSVLSFSCKQAHDSNQTSESENNYPCLEVFNDYQYDVITKVSLVGYTFDSLNICYGESQKFYLMNGMPAGYENINVAISVKSHITLNKKCNFANGKTTVAKYDL